ncbi:hypothetical protein EDD86DRAFT_213028 [Gorgonomyces haynaldii]|nr:hypothetical protein EDD86DRAFT_215639 [Gorgonomyces haynaldii]KAI8904891.1 hypothetical protein EDD86DRAFT_213028 [Gorgonomyces haynaldii]
MSGEEKAKTVILGQVEEKEYYSCYRFYARPTSNQETVIIPQGYHTKDGYRSHVKKCNSDPTAAPVLKPFVNLVTGEAFEEYKPMMKDGIPLSMVIQKSGMTREQILALVPKRDTSTRQPRKHKHKQVEKALGDVLHETEAVVARRGDASGNVKSALGKILLTLKTALNALNEAYEELKHVHDAIPEESIHQVTTPEGLHESQLDLAELSQTPMIEDSQPAAPQSQTVVTEDSQSDLVTNEKSNANQAKRPHQDKKRVAFKRSKKKMTE